MTRLPAVMTMTSCWDNSEPSRRSSLAPHNMATRTARCCVVCRLSLHLRRQIHQHQSHAVQPCNTRRPVVLVHVSTDIQSPNVWQILHTTLLQSSHSIIQSVFTARIGVVLIYRTSFILTLRLPCHQAGTYMYRLSSHVGHFAHISGSSCVYTKKIKSWGRPSKVSTTKKYGVPWAAKAQPRTLLAGDLTYTELPYS